MTQTERKPVGEMTVAELKAEAEERSIAVPARPRKEKLQRIIDEARGEDAVVEGEVVDEVEETRNLPAVRAAEAMVARAEVSSAEVVEQRDKIREVMSAVMVQGVHYGEIPGVSKPTLLKPGAEVLAVTFRLAPSYKSERTFHPDAHLTVVSVAKLTHIPTGLVVAEGEGLCTTYEKKYAYRGEGRTCPICGAGGTIKRSKYPPREEDYEGASRSDAPGWYCFAKVGGCSANFAHTDPRIVEQSATRVPNLDLPDTWNTVLKMANKRALVAAILNGTGASDIFTQDVEDAGEIAADTHETGNQASRQPQPQLPKTWAEVAAIAEEYGRELGWGEWVRDAAERLFKERELGNLSVEQKRTLHLKAAGAIVALREAHDPGAFPPPSREVVQKAWASVLEGDVLAGPLWRFSPDETEVPTYAEVHGEPEPEAPVVDGEATDADEPGAEPDPAEFTDPDDIDFGDPGEYP